MNRILAILLILAPLTAAAQKERADIRQGNRLYDNGKYTEAEVGYKRALEKNINSYEANFNLSGALYKQQRFEDAAVGYSKLAEDGSDSLRQADTFYNLGNSLLKQRKIDEAIEAYKNALRRKPDDQQAKFNLAYAKKLKEDEENKDNQDNNQNQDQNNDQNDNQNNQNQNQNNDQNQDQNQGQDDRQDQNQQDQPQQQPPPRQDSERLLNAVQASEDKTKEKLDKEQEKAASTKRQGKHW